MADKDPGPGGDQPYGIQDVTQGGIAGGVALRVINMGPEHLHGTVPGKFSTQVCAEDHRETAEETGGGGMVLPTNGDSHGGGGIRGYKGLNTK